MTGSSLPGPKGSSRSCCVTLPSPRLPPSPRRRRSRPQQGRQRHHRRCHHRSLRQRQSERADPLLPYLHLPLQEFQTQEGLQAEIVSTSQIRVDNRPADDPHSVARFECVLCPEQRRRSPLPLGIARQAGCNFQVVDRSSKLVLANLPAHSRRSLVATATSPLAVSRPHPYRRSSTRYISWQATQ